MPVPRTLRTWRDVCAVSAGRSKLAAARGGTSPLSALPQGGGEEVSLLGMAVDDRAEQLPFLAGMREIPCAALHEIPPAGRA